MNTFSHIFVIIHNEMGLYCMWLCMYVNLFHDFILCKIGDVFNQSAIWFRIEDNPGNMSNFSPGKGSAEHSRCLDDM